MRRQQSDGRSVAQSDQALSAFGSRRFLGRRSQYVPERGSPRLGSRLENAGPPIAQERLVLFRCPMGGLSHCSPAQGPAARADAEVLDQRCGKRLNLSCPHNVSVIRLRLSDRHYSKQTINLKASMQIDPTNSSPSVSRRQFIRTSSLVAASAAAAVSFPSVLRGAGTKPINAVIIGLGGRGSGAGGNFLEAVKNTGVNGKIVAIADLFPEAANRGTEAPFNVPADKCFSGFDAFQKVLALPGINYAILATPPGFRAPHFRACVEAGKNVFMEKPVAVDGPGARLMYETAELSKKKGLKVAAGTQRRHQAGYIETIKRIKDGAIGDVVTLRAYWVNGGPIWHRGDHGDTDLERQIRNWYHYIWLSGDHICEQHVHNLDVCNWIMQDHPVKAWGQGSRQQLGDKSGEIWDNFDVEFEYANGVHLFSYCGQIKRDWASVSEAVHGTKGTSRPDG